ncbi:toll-like receptor 13 [Centropristis striata]|uniref:toll-like receptor 13 n=1 Tax=Centropristis striata TaxID=184440 RepID=UPI0027E035B8|nr:toll-like receptor 13 [Centropristis striata]
MGRLSFSLKRRLLVSLLCLLLHLNSSRGYSLKHCSVGFSQDASSEVVVDCGNAQLVAVPDDLPRDAGEIRLCYNHLRQINRGDFGKLSQLRILYLDSNQIFHVDDGAFIHLGALTELTMTNNQLSSLTGNMFQGLSNLTLLNLSRNNIKLIHPLAFQSLSRLQTVILNINKLQHLPDLQPILQLPNLHKLSIRDNLFPSFETKDLQLNVSSSLKVLDISDSKLERFSITTKIFPHLQMIDFSRCGHAEGLKWDIPDKTLLSNITELYFSIVPLKEIRKVLQSLDSLTHLTLNYMEMLINRGLLATVCRIPTLKTLVLINNNVANLSAKLSNCSQLIGLDLSVMKMSELPEGSLRLMTQLSSLNVETNFLSRVPDDIRSLSSLEILNLSDNLISGLNCEDFANTTRLTNLFLNTNRISKLDRCVFENLNELQVLDLSDNLLLTFGGVFKTGPQQLQLLDLGKNLVSILEKGDFQGLGSLKSLDVVSNNIGRVKHEAFQGLSSLRNLSVSLPLQLENDFRSLRQLENLTVYLFIEDSLKIPHPNFSKAFFQLKSLKVFTIICKGAHYSLPDIPAETLRAMRHLEDFTAENFYVSASDLNMVDFNPQLKSLTVHQSDMSGLEPEQFHPIPNLQLLDLSGTNVKTLDFLSRANLSALRCLKLRDNEITVIDESIFQSLPALTYLDLSVNPFTCDCSNAGFIQWAKNNNQTLVDNGHQYDCAFPAAQRGRKLLDFDVQSCWTDFGFLCFVSSTCLTLLTLLTSFTYHFLRWQLAYTFHLFLAFLYDSRKRKKGAAHQYDAFISYNVHDEAWVYREMLPVLEGEQGWRLCLHHRDFQPGKPIVENITDAIYGSRKTICVISRRYLQSEWCSREIQMASFRLFDEQKDVLILLFLEDIPARQLSPYHRMRKLVKRRTYLSWPLAGRHTGVFWQNVQRALETGDAPTETPNLLAASLPHCILSR